MILVRFILIGVALFLIIRSFMDSGEKEKPSDLRQGKGESKTNGKKISKEIGEYVDYEELDKQKK